MHPLSILLHSGLGKGKEAASFKSITECLQHCTHLLLPTHLYCPQRARAPEIFKDGQNANNPSPQQGVALIQTPVPSASLNLAYSQRAGSGRLTAGNLP